MSGPKPKDITTRFWSKVEKTDGCWLWIAGIVGGGYGGFRIGSRKIVAHRMAYILTKGEIPEGMKVCHSCDTPRCCNPAHLWLGTTLENNQDRSRKGRSNKKPHYNMRGVKHPPGCHAGERASHAKLTIQQVNEIRARYIRRVITAKMLAPEYNVTEAAIWHIVAGHTWRDGNEPVAFHKDELLRVDREARHV